MFLGRYMKEIITIDIGSERLKELQNETWTKERISSSFMAEINRKKIRKYFRRIAEGKEDNSTKQRR